MLTYPWVGHLGIIGAFAAPLRFLAPTLKDADAFVSGVAKTVAVTDLHARDGRADEDNAMTGPVFVLIIVVVAVTLSLIMSVSWVVWRRTRNSGWIDATWTFGLGATGLRRSIGAILAVRLRVAAAGSRRNVHRRLVSAAWAPHRSAHGTHH